MSVLNEILEWSNDRPSWQRDALRRLVLNGELSNEDIQDLTAICKGNHGLANKQVGEPLAKHHIPDNIAGSEPVSLDSIFHHRGVNALAENQTLKFSPGLTIVYGDNGAGKTGYIRILKSACRARGQERILGNVVSGSSPPAPIVAIKYKIGNDQESREWVGGFEDEVISRVSVFDTQCAAVYLTEKTDVAFRPFGLDLFDKLVQSCKSVRLNLEAEQIALNTTTLSSVQATIPEGTAAAKLLANVSSLTKPEAVTALSRLSSVEVARLEFLEKSLLDLQVNDPDKLIRQLALRLSRIQILIRHVKNVETVLSDDAIRTVFTARDECHRKQEEAKRLREATFPPALLAGTGSESWAALWEAARIFSQEIPYSGQHFPVVDDGAQCVLCQQSLDHNASIRLTQFETFVASTTEQELREKKDNLTCLETTFADLKSKNNDVEMILKEIRIEQEELADEIAHALTENENRRALVAEMVASEGELTNVSPSLIAISHKVESLAKQIEERVATLRNNTNNETLRLMSEEAQELRARRLLTKHEATVLDAIECRKKFAAYSLCIDDTKANAITQKSSAVTKSVVSQKLKQGFKNELKNLRFVDVEVELKELGGKDGVFYHKLVLTRAPGVELPNVVSEGEQRCLSIAAFFAELSTADDPSGIVFDDPVSSLDFRWRNGVARRLVQESNTRQVIVFTHDIVFLLALRQFAQELGVKPLDQHVRHLPMGAGVCTDELPWVALPVKRKIGFLNKTWQSADKLARDGHQDAYEREAIYIYGLLREAWERSIEEVLLDGIVERYRPGIQTQQIAKIADITEADCKEVDNAMTKCSAWLPGHDQAAAARAPVPQSDELKADIDALENWVKKIRKRRA